MSRILLNLTASALLSAGALVLAAPKRANACDFVLCSSVCWVDAAGNIGCSPTICVCI